MSSDSDDDMLMAKICQFVATGMDSVLLRHPDLFGLNDSPKNDSDSSQQTDIQSLCQSIDDFHSHYRMSRRCFGDLMDKIASNNKIFDLEKKLLFTLCMLTSLETYESVGSGFNFTERAGRKAFVEVLNAVLSLFTDYVRWPSENEYDDIANEFKNISGGNIRGVVGAIDACHIDIRQPSIEHNEYRNQRDTFSLVLQAVCDHRKVFTNVYVGSPGGWDDTKVYRQSKICSQLDKLVSGDYHIIGDSAYPLLRNLVTPFTGELNATKSHFNKILGNARRVVEQSLNMLRGRFKKLNYIHSSNLELVNKIVCSCIILHNHIRMFDVDDDETQFLLDTRLVGAYNTNAEVWDQRQERKKAGFIKRNRLMSFCCRQN